MCHFYRQVDINRSWHNSQCSIIVHGSDTPHAALQILSTARDACMSLDGGQKCLHTTSE